MVYTNTIMIYHGLVLLSRDNFREGVFARDGHKCVVCGDKGVDAHHIIERRLFSEPHEKGGYFLNNGATVCEKHHIECEQTIISVEQIREFASITKKILPSQVYDDVIYDKWLNEILASGLRLRGALFQDESVQKILKAGGVLSQFTNRVKYPRTCHAPWSPGIHDDDRVISSMDNFIGRRVIVHEKMDGECTTMYNDYIHARSIDGRHHSSRDWVKNFHGQIAHEIPEDWRINVENMYAKHSISYDKLASYAYGFHVWNAQNYCLSWDEDKIWFELLNIEPCPVIYDGIYDEKIIRGLYNEKTDWETREGYVIRIADGFHYSEFHNCVAKYVRARHVQTSRHWMHGQEVIPNKLRNE